MLGLSNPRASPNTALSWTRQGSAEFDGCSEIGGRSAAGSNLKCQGKLRTASLAVASVLVVLLLVTLALHPGSSLTSLRKDSTAGLAGIVGELAVVAGHCKSSKKWCENR